MPVARLQSSCNPVAKGMAYEGEGVGAGQAVRRTVAADVVQFVASVPRLGASVLADGARALLGALELRMTAHQSTSVAVIRATQDGWDWPLGWRHEHWPVREPGEKTGAPPPELAQDDCRALSKWFASRPDARRLSREAAERIAESYFRAMKALGEEV